MSLSSLPSELYSAILSHVDDEHVQLATLALTRVLPHAPIPLEHLFAQVCLRQPQQVVQLHRRLRTAKADACYVREFRLESWTADAQVVINLLALLDCIVSLTLFVGPNFAPEDLLEVFERPRERLQSLSLRFRPYVQRANYFHFLKGAYFDSTLSALSRWPSASLQTLSITQDPYIGQTHFAQPLVFFNFQPLLTLSIAPVSAHITSLRLRIPARDVTPYIAAAPLAFPTLTALDLSTGNVKDVQLARLLVRFARLRHVRLDACSLLSTRENPAAPVDSEWAALGRACALAGVRRAKEREKELKAWRDAVDAAAEPDANQQHVAPRVRARAGRKGLATAAISLRGASEPEPIVAPITPKPSSSATRAALRVTVQKIRIVPSPPSLLTLCTSTITNAAAAVPAAADEVDTGASARFLQAREEFNRGWVEGIATLRAIWLRLRTSHKNGMVRVMSLSDDADLDTEAEAGTEEGLVGLVDLESWTELDKSQWPCAVLCLAGERPDAPHNEGCGHSVTRELWVDNE